MGKVIHVILILLLLILIFEIITIVKLYYISNVITIEFDTIININTYTININNVIMLMRNI